MAERKSDQVWHYQDNQTIIAQGKIKKPKNKEFHAKQNAPQQRRSGHK